MSRREPYQAEDPCPVKPRSFAGNGIETRAQDRRAAKDAIDGRLSSVHFTKADARAVMQAVSGDKKRTRARRKRAFLRADLIFTFAVIALFALPLSRIVMRSRERVTTITAGPGQATMQPMISSQHDADIVSAQEAPLPTALPTAPPAADAQKEGLSSMIGESEAIRIARECFNAQCDTTIFTFEEYEVSAVLSEEEPARYTVTMNSIYHNGCRFTVVIRADGGEILQFSSPRLASIPPSVNYSSSEVLAWQEKYGEHLFTWPQDAQAEFSRRYQGATLRTAREGELSCEAVISAVSAHLEGKAPHAYTAFYPVLYSERASSDAQAFYIVYCYPDSSEETLAGTEPMMVSIDAVTGGLISVEGSPAL